MNSSHNMDIKKVLTRELDADCYKISIIMPHLLILNLFAISIEDSKLLYLNY